VATSDGQEKTAPSLSLATRLPVPSLILVLATTIPLAYLARSIHFDGSPRPLLPQSEGREATGIGPDLDGEDALVIGVFADDVFRPATLAKIDDLSTNLWHLDGVATVSSPTTLLHPVKTSEGVRLVPLLGALPKTAEEAAAFRTRVLDHPLAVGNVVSADGTAAAIKVHLKLRGAGAKDRRAMVEEIRESVAAAGGPERFALAGSPLQVIEAADLLRRHLLVATAAALALTAVAGLLALRSMRGVLLALATACTAIAWVLGSMVAVRQPIDFCTVDLAPLFALLAAAPAMVIVARYDQERGRGALSHAAGLATMDAMRLPLILTALATLIGSGAFFSSRFPALRAFSLHAGAGVAGMLAAWLLLVPAALVVLPGAATRRRSPRLLTGRLESIGGVLDRHRGLLILIGCAVLVAALIGSSRLRVQTGYLQYLQRAGTSARDADLIAEKLWGPNAISVVIDGHRPRAVLELDSLKALRDLQHFINEQPGVNATRSLVDYVELIRRSRGEPRGVLPASQEEIDSLFDFEPAALYDVANKKLSRTRIVVRTGIVDTAEMTHLLERIDAYASPKLLHRALGKRNMFPNGFLVRSMGTSVRLYESAERLRREAWRALGRVAAALAAVIALFFLSLRIAAVCLILGGVPVLTLVGLMGWLGMPLTHVSAVLPPLLLGIAVGHTGHYLSAFGTSTQATAADASGDVVAYLGLPLLYGAFALAAGCLLLSFAPFPPLRWLGHAGCLGIALALTVNGLLLATRVLRRTVITISDLLYLKIGRLEELPLFTGLRPFQSKIVMLTGQLASAAPGDFIARRGEVKPELYVLISGRAEVRTGDGGPAIGNLLRGEVIGEMGLVRDQPRSADVIAVESTEYLVIDGHFLERLRRQYPRIAAIVFLNLTKILSDRLERTTARVVELTHGGR
jgi:predicted RND superfamily exporter protein